MEKIITTRLPNEFVVKLNYIANQEGLDVSTTMRKLLANAIKEWKIEQALEGYRKGKLSFGQSVKLAEISPWDFPELLKQKNITINYDLEEFEEDLKTIKWKK